jgi:hypothetical protein
MANVAVRVLFMRVAVIGTNSADGEPGRVHSLVPFDQPREIYLATHVRGRVFVAGRLDMASTSGPKLRGHSLVRGSSIKRGPLSSNTGRSPSGAELQDVRGGIWTGRWDSDGTGTASRPLLREQSDPKLPWDGMRTGWTRSAVTMGAFPRRFSVCSPSIDSFFSPSLVAFRLPEQSSGRAAGAFERSSGAAGCWSQHSAGSASPPSEAG